MVDFLAPGGQLILAAAVGHDGLPGAHAPRGAHRVHGHVAAAHHDDALSLQHRRVRVGTEGPHEVDAGEVLVGRVDALEVLAGDAHEDRQPGSHGDEHGIEVLAQLAQRPGLADDGVDLDGDAQTAQPIDLLLHDVLGQPEFRDAVDEHPARGVEGLEDGHLVAGLGELSGGGQAGRPGADDGDAAAGIGVLAHVQLIEVLHGPVSHEPLQGTDRDGLALLAPDAQPFALGLLRDRRARSHTAARCRRAGIRRRP